GHLNLNRKKVIRFLKLNVTKSRKIGVVCGTTPGVQEWGNTANQFMVVCINTCGPTVLKNVWNLQIIPLWSILGSPFLPIHPEKCFLIIYKAGLIKVMRAPLYNLIR